MMNNTLSSFARVGVVAYLAYLAWPTITVLYDKVLTGQPTLEEWMYVVFLVLFSVVVVLALAAVALLLLFCLLYALRNTLRNYIRLILRDATALRCGR